MASSNLLSYADNEIDDNGLGCVIFFPSWPKSPSPLSGLSVFPSLEQWGALTCHKTPAVDHEDGKEEEEEEVGGSGGSGECEVVDENKDGVEEEKEKETEDVLGVEKGKLDSVEIVVEASGSTNSRTNVPRGSTADRAILTKYLDLFRREMVQFGDDSLSGERRSMLKVNAFFK